jgi:hypothetical protein
MCENLRNKSDNSTHNFSMGQSISQFYYPRILLFSDDIVLLLKYAMRTTSMLFRCYGWCCQTQGYAAQSPLFQQDFLVLI